MQYFFMHRELVHLQKTVFFAGFGAGLFCSPLSFLGLILHFSLFFSSISTFFDGTCSIFSSSFRF
jgi:hypothetical protein